MLLIIEYSLKNLKHLAILVDEREPAFKPLRRTCSVLPTNERAWRLLSHPPRFRRFQISLIVIHNKTKWKKALALAPLCSVMILKLLVISGSCRHPQHWLHFTFTHAYPIIHLLKLPAWGQCSNSIRRAKSWISKFWRRWPDQRWQMSTWSSLQVSPNPYSSRP